MHKLRTLDLKLIRQLMLETNKISYATTKKSPNHKHLLFYDLQRQSRHSQNLEYPREAKHELCLSELAAEGGQNLDALLGFRPKKQN